MSDHLTFGSLQIAFDEQVLRPRGWTTAQSLWAADLLPDVPEGPVLELCAGAGQIGLLAVLDSSRSLVCVDANEVACDFARANAQAAGISERVEVRTARLESALDPGERFSLVIADPPWVPRDEIGRYPEDPTTAIDGGGDGMEVARACLRVIDAHLEAGGAALLQLGTKAQAAALAHEEPVRTGSLEVVEVRQEERGVLVRIDRR